MPITLDPPPPEDSLLLDGPLGLPQCLPAQLNAADLQEASELQDANSDDHNDILDSTNDQEALCMNKIQDRPWINIPEETQKK
ncbi:hypothetical protein E4T56_gene8152 [Termitomyces sp. T112]|nr:hypothetical protein E4T56_gene8152 [Termitomyces sp. T112]